MSNKIKPASMLSYARSINIADGFMFAASSQGDKPSTPILISSRSLRTTFSNHSETKKATDQKALSRSNIQSIEVATIPEGYDTLVVTTSVSFQGQALAPYACNDQEVTEHLSRFAQLYSEKGGFKVLAELYVKNLASGSWMWRNKQNAGNCCTVTLTEGGVDYVAETLSGDTRYVEGDFEQLINRVAKALSRHDSDPEGFVRLCIRGSIKTHEGSEVFPSQIFPDNGKAGRFLSFTKTRANEKQAIIHQQKIGNAIRTIDTWYNGEDGASYALPVEPFGIDRKAAAAWRVDNKTDFYSLMTKDTLRFIDTLEDINSPADIHGNIHFMAACLVRGGVYSIGGDK